MTTKRDKISFTSPQPGEVKARMLRRRVFLSWLAAAALMRPRAARAQADWPTRPVRVMVPYPPAGGADTTARMSMRD